MVRDPRVSYDADSSLVNDYDNSTDSSGMPSRLRATERPERNDPRQSRKRGLVHGDGGMEGWISRAIQKITRIRDRISKV